MLSQAELADFACFSEANKSLNTKKIDFLEELLSAGAKTVKENSSINNHIIKQTQENSQTESEENSNSVKSKLSSPADNEEEAFIPKKKKSANFFANKSFSFFNNQNHSNNNDNFKHPNDYYNSNLNQKIFFNKYSDAKNTTPQTTKQTNPQKPKNISLVNSQTIQTPGKHIVWQIAWHPQDSLFATCGYDNNICIWGLDFTSKKYTIKAILEDSNNSQVKSIAWDNTGNYIASAGFEFYTNIWKKDGMDFECIATVESHENAVKNVAWSVTGSFLLTCAEKNENVWIWKIRLEDEFVCDATLTTHKDEVRVVKWSPVDDVFFSCGGSDEVLKVWGRSRDRSDREWELLNSLDGHKDSVKDFAISKDALFIISISENGSVILWKIEDIHYKNIIQFKKIDYELNKNIYVSCSINFNQDLIVLGTSDNKIKLLYLDKKNTSQNLYELTNADSSHEDKINTVSFDSAKNVFITSSEDRSIKVWTIMDI